jgi:tetratricopeptide (TPR) repeat protein
MDWTESHYSQQTAIRFARAGALVRIVVAGDACEVCRAMARRTYTPSEVPRLPIRGCTHEQCRCQFVAVDPETELTVPQLVQRGAQALRAGRLDLAEQTLRRAVALDEQYELGWLWLSGVVDDQEKVACLRKVLEINPENVRAQEGLAQLQERLAPAAKVATRVPEPAVEVPQTAEPILSEASEESKALPREALELREERQVIVEQWTDFISIAPQADPQMVSMQGRAFLTKLQELNAQALAVLSPDMRMDELQVQWVESEKMGDSLADLIQVHESRRDDGSQWQAMRQAIRALARQLLGHRNALRDQITAIGGSTPQV